MYPRTEIHAGRAGADPLRARRLRLSSRARFRVRGDVVDIYPVHEEDRAVRMELLRGRPSRRSGRWTR
ncbi:MAG: hypothetical protein U5J62_07580 [Desulfurivibrio sp.]|nr:hypothetical protein [Desulfurivibrio sp.]